MASMMLLRSARKGDLEAVQRLVAGSYASVAEKTTGGSTVVMLAANIGNSEVVQWLLQYGGANISDCDSDGRTAWEYLWKGLDPLNPSAGELALIKVMLARGPPPPFFTRALVPALQPVLGHGLVVCQRLPADSVWRAQRTAELYASECDRQLVLSVLTLVAGYAEASEEDVWAVLDRDDLFGGGCGTKRHHNRTNKANEEV